MSMVLRHPRGVAIVAAAAGIALCLVLVVVASADASRQATAIGLIATMNAPSEVPAPTGDVSVARGAFTATASQDGTGAGLDWTMSFSGLTGPATAAHIHVAPRGQPGPVVVPLCAPCTSPASGTASVDAATLAAIQAGGAYVNVHTDRNRAGEIRGQVGIAAPVRTALTAAREVPKPKGNVRRATGSLVATVTKEGTTGAVAWRLTFARLTGPAVAAHIHVAPRGQPGPVVVPLCAPCSSPASGTANLDATLLAAIQAGGAYVNVHTDRNRAGEIRGQVGITAPLRTALGSRQEVPKPKGNVRRSTGSFVATVAKEGTTGAVTWRLTFARLTGSALAAHIHIGRAGRAGPVAVALCGPCRNGQRGSAVLNAATLAALEAGRGYVNIHTKRNPAGEVRGQLPAAALRIG